MPLPRLALRPLWLLLFCCTASIALPAEINPLLKRGQQWEAEKNYAAAIATYSQAIAADPRNAIPYSLRGWASHLQGDEAAALADLSRALELDPAYDGARDRRARIHIARKDYAAAAADFAEMVRRNPKNARALYDLALCQQRLGQTTEATATAGRMIAADPGNLNGFNLRAGLREKSGDLAGALADSEAALKLAQDDKSIATLTRNRDRLVQLADQAPRAPSGAPASPPGPPASAGKTAVARGAAVATAPAIATEKLALNGLSAGQYNGAVSVAMAGMRLLQAPMSEAATAKFEKAWTPMFRHPDPGNVAYLNQLNPLLQEWLALRSQLAEAAAAYDRAIEEARFAAGYESASGVRTAMAEAGRHLALLQAGKARLAELAARIAQLGDPPDAAAAHRQRRSQHAAAVRTARRVAGLPDADVYLKVDFSRQPEGWSHQLSLGAIAAGGSKGGGFSETILPSDQRFAYLHPEDSPLNSRHPRDQPDRFWRQNDLFGSLVFQYHGADLLAMGSLHVQIGLVHAPLEQAEDLGKLETDRLLLPWKQRTFGSLNVAAHFGYTMSLVRQIEGDKWWDQLRAEYYDVIALDLGDDYWLAAIVQSKCAPERSEDPSGEKIRWAEQQPKLRARLQSRVRDLLEHLQLELVPRVPAEEAQRLNALRDYARANPLRTISETDLARLADWRAGHWVLRDGVDPENPIAGNLHDDNSGYTRFPDGTEFGSTWGPLPPRLEAGTVLAFELKTESRQQGLGRHPDGSTYVVEHTAQARADWSGLASPTGSRTSACETAPAHSNPRFGERRTIAKLQVPIAGPSAGKTRKVTFEFTNSADPSPFFNHKVVRLYDWVWSIRGDNPAIPPSVLPASLTSEPRTPPLTPAEVAQAEAERKWRKERIAEIRQNIAFLEINLAREQDELRAERDPARRAAYEFRVLGLRSDIQHEEDLIASLETGTDVHTRSPFDQYAAAVFQQQCQSEARDASQMIRAVAAAERLTALLPADEAERVRGFVSRQLTPQVVGSHDVAAARAVLNAVSTTVRGHLEGAAAKADLDAATAQLGIDAAENIKAGADTGMSVCSLFGGASINLLYQAGTGYIEGGPVQALKQAATTWSDTIDYAVTAYEAYQAEGTAGAAQTVALKYIQNQTMGYLAGRFMADAGPGRPAATPLRKPTLQEQFDAAKFQQERKWGEALVQDFARAHLAVQQAGTAGASPATIQQLQLAAHDKAAAVASSLHAKNALKYRAPSSLGQAYDAHLRSLHAATDADLKRRMRQAGWNADDWELVEIRNAASLGQPNMDRDVGLRERSLWEVDDHGRPIPGPDGRPIPNPQAWSTGRDGQPVPKPQLTKDGKPMTLDHWRDEAQHFYNQAYRRTSGGRSAEVALESVTTTTHPEAYKDLLWLNHDKSLINRAWAGQAADVSRYKALHTLQKSDPTAAYFTRLQEVARGTAKDLETKFMPLLRAAKPIPGTGLRPAPALSAAALQQAREHWTGIQKVLTAFGRNDLDPITATRRIRELTGGRSIPEVVDQMGTLLESLAKGARR